MSSPVPPTSPRGSGCVGERVGSGEGGWSGSVFRDNPGVCESHEVKGLEYPV